MSIAQSSAVLKSILVHGAGQIAAYNLLDITSALTIAYFEQGKLILMANALSNAHSYISLVLFLK